MAGRNSQRRKRHRDWLSVACARNKKQVKIHHNMGSVEEKHRQRGKFRNHIVKGLQPWKQLPDLLLKAAKSFLLCFVLFIFSEEYF